MPGQRAVRRPRRDAPLVVLESAGAQASPTRDFEDQKSAGIAAADVPKLKLKWAFGFPGVKIRVRPAVRGWGPRIRRSRYRRRLFLGRRHGLRVLDVPGGLRRAQRGHRRIASGARYVAYFGDGKANVYAVDAATGQQIWKTHVDEHASARITGGTKVFEGRVYVPVASGEEGAGPNRNYPCCTFRGSVVALDAATGKQVWKTYTIAEEPKPLGKNSNGVQRFGPAGGGVWNSPTIDPARHALYVGTGDAYTEPAPDTTDAIMAMDLNTGKILWSVQDTQNDTGWRGATVRRLLKIVRRSWARITISGLRRF